MLVTWNLQGSNASTEAKWGTAIGHLLTGGYPDAVDFICLQESGAPPASATLRGKIPQKDPKGGETEILVHDWGGSQRRGTRHLVLLHEWDTAGGRVNTAIVSREERPGAVTAGLIWPPAGWWRPALWLAVTGHLIAAFHAISPTGHDAEGLVGQVATAAGGLPWVVAADFNREPGSFGIPAGSVCCPPDHPTHPATDPRRSLDYCVRSGMVEQAGAVLGSLYMSDHLPVAYSFP